MLWHRLDLNFASDESFTGRLAEYTCGSGLPLDRRGSCSRPHPGSRGPAVTPAADEAARHGKIAKI